MDQVTKKVQSLCDLEKMECPIFYFKSNDFSESDLLHPIRALHFVCLGEIRKRPCWKNLRQINLWSLIWNIIILTQFFGGWACKHKNSGYQSLVYFSNFVHSAWFLRFWCVVISYPCKCLIHQGVFILIKNSCSCNRQVVACGLILRSKPLWYTSTLNVYI